MSILFKSTIIEIKKLLIKKKYIVITILGALFCILRLGGGMLIGRLSGGEISVRSNLPFEMLPFAIDILSPLIVFMAVTDLFACEVQDNTIKAALLRPVTRFKVMLSKSLAAFFIGAASCLAMFTVSLTVQILSGGEIKRVPVMLMAYLIDMIPLIGVIALSVLINLISKGPTLSMLLCIAVYVFFKYLNLFVLPVGQMIFTAYTQWHKLWIGSVLPFSALAPKIGILFGSILILYTLSYIIFDRQDY